MLGFPIIGTQPGNKRFSHAIWFGDHAYFFSDVIAQLRYSHVDTEPTLAIPAQEFFTHEPQDEHSIKQFSVAWGKITTVVLRTPGVPRAVSTRVMPLRRISANFRWQNIRQIESMLYLGTRGGQSALSSWAQSQPYIRYVLLRVPSPRTQEVKGVRKGRIPI